jgi:glutamate dehydrogenase
LKTYRNRVQKYIDAVCKQLPKAHAQELEAFVASFYQKTPIAELEAIDEAEAAAMAVQAYEFTKQRKVGGEKIRLYKPTKKEHGWDHHGWVLEILNDDMPFLVDSVTAELQQHGLVPEKLIHPIFHVVRDNKGTLQQIEQKGEKKAIAESFMHISLPVLPMGVTPDFLQSSLHKILRVVRQIVADWKPMQDRCAELEDYLKQGDFPVKKEELNEAVALLEWLREGNFIFLGSLNYRFYDDHGQESLHAVEGSELGLFRIEDLELKPPGLTALPPEVRHFAMLPHLVEITKSNRKSIVHRPVHMDYVGFKHYDDAGKVIGEVRFLGLFTSKVYYRSVHEIPIIRRKAQEMMAQAGFDATSHDGKALQAIIEFTPRDELFQMTTDVLFNYAMGVLSAEANPDVHLFLRRDLFERFISCTVFVPRDLFNTTLREEIQRILEEEMAGKITAFFTQMTESAMARLQLIVRTKPGAIPDFDQEAIRLQIAKVAYRWNDMLRSALIEHHGEKRGEQLYQRFGNAFSKSYVNDHDVKNAVYDIERILKACETSKMELELFEEHGTPHLKLYNPNAHIALSDILPVLENLGFCVIDERPYTVNPTGDGARRLWLRDFRLRVYHEDKQSDLKALKDKLETLLFKVWDGEADNDGFNSLTLYAGIHWREVMLLRAYGRYARQISLPYSNRLITQSLIQNPAIAAELVALFFERFDPDKYEKETAREKAVKAKLKEIEARLSEVQSLEQDRILRLFRDLIMATWRTNYFQKDENGEPKSYLSFKFNSAAVPDLPLPRPYAEIFVYSRRTEGIHLRGGKVARGGLRWSDRVEDYRTEVLGLMKAQMVKNALIVPVGSKGGFVVKQPPAGGDRAAMMEEGIACYKTYLRGLLDLTDNLVDGKVSPPPRVVRHDGDDSYLVVAADKGTATFSDYANEVAAEYGFWLDDAFASGGSVGYDHKAMGITARGAWVAVQRHFREMGVDVQKEDFTCIGIGDMSGDVFGNGMLLSKHIKLVGAFNHLHIFLDPDPDAAISFRERKRLFNLPRSSWEDYNAELISEGGGVFSRQTKEIPLSPQIQTLLGVKASKMAPDALISAMLKAEVDLLWNGGIGTYIKAEDETHEQVGDRANNSLRVNANEVRAKVIGEGGNLGITQRGRIEYAMQGGCINTDAIDNSAGVDCSDHEVNIKIAFRILLENNTITMEERNEILESMTGDVAELVLKDNELQTQAITMSQLQGSRILESQSRVMQRLEKRKLLNRKVEYLPSAQEMDDRKQAGKGLTRPEISVLLAYSKMAVYQDLLDSALPDESYLRKDLYRYFPEALREKYPDALDEHRLRREIIATSVTNSIVNRAGITFYDQLLEDTGMPACDIARAYIIARDGFDVHHLWKDIESLSGKTPAATQAAMQHETSRFMERAVSWFLRTLPQPLNIEQVLKVYKPGIANYLENSQGLVSRTLKRAYENKLQRFMDMGTPKAMAHRIARLEIVSCALDVVKIHEETALSFEQVGSTYFELGATLRLGWLRREASRVNAESHWEKLAAKSIIHELYDQQRRLTYHVIPHIEGDISCQDAVAKWEEKNRKTIERYNDFIMDLKAQEHITFPMLVIALRNVEAICSV